MDSMASMLEGDETTGSGDRRCRRCVTVTRPLRADKERNGNGNVKRLPGSRPMPSRLKEAGPGKNKPRKDCCGHWLANRNGMGRFSCPPTSIIALGNLRFDPGQ